MFQKKQNESVKNCGVVTNGFTMFSCFTTLVPNVLSNTRQSMALKAAELTSHLWVQSQRLMESNTGSAEHRSVGKMGPTFQFRCRFTGVFNFS